MEFVSGERLECVDGERVLVWGESVNGVGKNWSVWGESESGERVEWGEGGVECVSGARVECGSGV